MGDALDLDAAQRAIRALGIFLRREPAQFD